MSARAARFASWDEAAEAIAANQRRLARVITAHDDWAADGAAAICREDKGEIVFDYDQAIAVPFNSRRRRRRNVDMWPLFAALARAAAAGHARREQRPAERRSFGAEWREQAPNVTSATIAGVGHAPS